MKKIILAAVNARYSHTNIAVRYLRNSVRDLGVNVRLHEFTINQTAREIADCLIEEGPDVAAFSVYIWNALVVAAVLPLLKNAMPHCLIVLGGPEVTYSADAWLGAHPETDCIVRGPGEAAFKHLAANGMNLDVPVIEVPNPPFDLIPFPYEGEDMAALDNRTIYYESSRGCPFRCSYCLSSRADQRLDYRSMSRVNDELAYIMAAGPAYVKFVDRTFNADRARCRHMWERIIDRYGGSNTLFHFEINPALLGDDDFMVLRSSPKGLFQFELGIQSTNEDALREVNRAGDFAVIKENIERLRGMGNIHIHVDLIAGLPREDEESLRRSFNRIYSLGADHFQPGLLKILHGTEMKARADAEGYAYSDEPPYQVRSTPWLSAGAVAAYESVAYLVERLYNGGSFPLTLEYLLGLFAAPYDLYDDMAAFYRGPAGVRLDRGRESCAAFLAAYAQSKMVAQSKKNNETIAENGVAQSKTASKLLAQSKPAAQPVAQSKIPLDLPYFTDCLRWDWCRGAANRHYARSLKSDSTRRAAKKFMGMVHLFMKEGGPASPPLSGDEVKRAIVFSPETDAFGDRYMGGRGIAVFVQGRPGPVLV